MRKDVINVSWRICTCTDLTVFLRVDAFLGRQRALRRGVGTAALLLDTLHISCSICNIGRHCRVQTHVPDYPNSQLQTLHITKLHLRTIYGHILPRVLYCIIQDACCNTAHVTPGKIWPYMVRSTTMQFLMGHSKNRNGKWEMRNRKWGKLKFWKEDSGVYCCAK